VDQMRGTIAQACRYVSKEETKKDKNCDNDPWCFPSDMIKIDPKEYADKWLIQWLSIDNKYVNMFASEWEKSLFFSQDTVRCPVVPLLLPVLASPALVVP